MDSSFTSVFGRLGATRGFINVALVILVVSLLAACNRKDVEEELVSLVKGAVPASTVSVFHHWGESGCWESQIWITSSKWPVVPGKAISLPGCVHESELAGLFESGSVSGDLHDSGALVAHFRGDLARVSVFSQDLMAFSSGEGERFMWATSNTVQPGQVRFDCLGDDKASTEIDLGRLEFESVDLETSVHSITCIGKSAGPSQSRVRLINYLSSRRGLEMLYSDSRQTRGLSFSDAGKSSEVDVSNFKALVLIHQMDSSVLKE